MSTLQLTLKLFRHNLRSTAAYLCALMLSIGLYYDFTLLKYSPEALGGRSDSNSVVVCAVLMSIVMLVVFFAFVWSSSRFFLRQRKKEIGLYALCGIPMRRAGRVFFLDSVITGLCALLGGLVLGLFLTKLFLMGAALMIKLEAPMAFTISLPALLETALIVLGIFLIVGLRNAYTVRRSKLIDLLEGMRVREMPPKRRRVRAVLAILALLLGYMASILMQDGLIIILCVPILVLVILGSYWAFEALLPAILERLSKNKNFFYRGIRMVGISNLWYRLRTNYRNLALTSVLSATAIVTLCTALTMSDYVGAREGKYAQRYIRSYSLTAWMEPGEKSGIDEILSEYDIDESKIIWVPTTLVAEQTKDGYGEYVGYVVAQSDAQAAAQGLMPLVNLPMPDINVAEGEALELMNPDRVALIRISEDAYELEFAGEKLSSRSLEDLWFWGGNSQIGQAYIVPDNWLSSLESNQMEPRLFLGLQISDETAESLLARLNDRYPSLNVERNQALTTHSRMTYGTLAYLGLVLFAVFSISTGCALIFKQLSEATTDRLKYQSMIHIGATRREVARAVGVQVGLSLLAPLLLGFVHAAFAVRVMGSIFMLETLAYLFIAFGVYAAVVAVLYFITMKRFMRIVT